MDNREVAKKLLDYAQFLEAREANLYRVKAYRRAAETVLALPQPLADLIAAEGRAGLEALPGIGPRLSYTLDELIRTGEFRTLNAEGGQVDPEQVLGSLPGVGWYFARQLHDNLGYNT